MQPTPAPLRDRARVVIVEDHGLFAESLEVVLTMAGYDARWLVPDAGSTYRSVLAAVVRHRPHVVLLDLDLGALGTSAGLIRPLAKGGASVVVVTATADRTRWGECLARGARGVLSKSRPLNAVQGAVRAAVGGRPVMDRDERESLIRDWRAHDRSTRRAIQRLERLTPREQQVLGHLMAGRTVHEVAVLGVVSEATVRTQVKSILAKLAVTSQIAAVGVAHELGWHSPLEAVPGGQRTQ